jgi:ATP-dependent Clp protease ATP-binding subunit ClpB
VESKVTQALRSQFKPEFLNRVDDVVIFRPLGEDQIGNIAELQLGRLHKLLAPRKITLTLSAEARKLIASEGFEPAFGARPLKRAIQRMIQDPLALALLEGKFGDGDTIRAVVEGDHIAFAKA